MKVHFIAIGGAVMHNLALSLRNKGYEVSGSDDEIFEPAYTNLQKAGLLPQSFGWFVEKIVPELDAVILGMHARADNPELQKAKALGLKIYSFPAYTFEQTIDKTRVVIGGSHGKTTVTAMIMFVLHQLKKDFDYLVGSKIEGFDLMVNFTHDAPVAIIEGDEYLSSALEPVPKFHFYKPHVAVLTGIAWDHINVFPTFENYVSQFEKFIDTIALNGKLIYCEDDAVLRQLAIKTRSDIQLLAYKELNYEAIQEKLLVKENNKVYEMQVFGKHNMMNMNAARHVCNALGIDDDTFFTIMQQFKGAAKRLELVAKNVETIIYKDFAHSPSKLKATVSAVNEMYPARKVIACMELHTFSSLNKNFLEEYKHAMYKADLPIVFFNHHTIDMKKLQPISTEEVKNAFDDNRLEVITDKEKLLQYLYQQDYNNSILLMMRSGNLEGLDWKDFTAKILSKS